MESDLKLGVLELVCNYGLVTCNILHASYVGLFGTKKKIMSDVFNSCRSCLKLSSECTNLYLGVFFLLEQSIFL